MGKLTTNRIRLTLLAMVTLVCGHTHSPPLERPFPEENQAAAPATIDGQAFVPTYFQPSPGDDAEDDPGFAASIMRPPQGTDLPPGLFGLGDFEGLLSWKFVGGEPVRGSFIIPPLAERPRRRPLEGIPLPRSDAVVEWDRPNANFPQGGPPRMLIPEPSTVALVRDALLCGLASGVVFRLAGPWSTAPTSAAGQSILGSQGSQAASRRRERRRDGERLA